MSTPDEMGLSPEAARGYEEFFVPAIFGQWPPVMLDAAAVGEGEVVLDVGCGTGVLTRELTKRLGDSGSATGFDLSESMLGIARAHCPDAIVRLLRAKYAPFKDATGAVSFPLNARIARVNMR